VNNVHVEGKVRTLMSITNVVTSPDEAGPRAHPAPVARFENVSVSVGDEAKGPRGVSFALAPGSFHTLTGAPGGGKSAILRLLSLGARPARGRIQIFGRDVFSLSRAESAAMRQRIGQVFPQMPFLDHLSVFDNAGLVPRLAGRKVDDYAGDVCEVLRWVGLGRRLHDRPSGLSAGERRSLTIARAVANRPEIVLADEPTADLDPLSARRVLRLLAELAIAGTTVVLATSDDDLAGRCGAPILHLHEGRMTLLEGPMPGFLA